MGLETQQDLNKVFVRLIDGTLAWAPVEGIRLSDNHIRITGNAFLDADDTTTIWEFLPGDTVQVINDGSKLKAVRLVEPESFERRKQLLLFTLISAQGNLSGAQKREFSDLLVKLQTDAAFLFHPDKRNQRYIDICINELANETKDSRA